MIGEHLRIIALGPAASFHSYQVAQTAKWLQAGNFKLEATSQLGVLASSLASCDLRLRSHLRSARSDRSRPALLNDDQELRGPPEIGRRRDRQHRRRDVLVVLALLGDIR